MPSNAETLRNMETDVHALRELSALLAMVVFAGTEGDGLSQQQCLALGRLSDEIDERSAALEGHWRLAVGLETGPAQPRFAA